MQGAAEQHTTTPCRDPSSSPASDGSKRSGPEQRCTNCGARSIYSPRTPPFFLVRACTDAQGVCIENGGLPDGVDERARPRRRRCSPWAGSRGTARSEFIYACAGRIVILSWGTGAAWLIDVDVKPDQTEDGGAAGSSLNGDGGVHETEGWIERERSNHLWPVEA